ncbi:tetratricopeptide repeat protein [Bacteroides uniformis]|uniref:tetratricopeptide repeat protein n=1 Tax=Bacteroides uniformis TaxID=820 RepID=UPI0039B3ED8B
MKKQTIALIAILTALLTACTETTGYNTTLVQADSLMNLHPDSALNMLESISTDSLKTKADRAYHALLLTQARDKNYIVQTDDSLIQVAVRYYDTHENAPLQARAYYCWGSLYRDRNDYSQAIDKYTIALSHINGRSENAELKASLYSNLGYLYYTQGLSTEADSIYQRAELLAKSQKDTASLCYTLSQRGMISLEQGKTYYPKAEQQMQQALSIGKAFSDSTILVPIYHSLSMLYSLMPKPGQALLYARLNYSGLKDTQHCYRTFLLLGNAYFINGQYDSAGIFLQKILKAERYYDTKADACMPLSEIAQKKGDMETSILLERKRTMYQDSAQINQQGHDILNTVIAHERNNSNTISKRSTYILCTVSTIFLAISFVCIFYFRKKHLQHKAEKKEWEETLQAEIAKANLRRKQELAEKERENATLQEKVSQLVVKKPTHRQEEYKTSALYIKVSRITKDLQKVETKENLNEEEWSQFTALTNAGWYGIITYLDERYNLSAEEIRICCLYLAQVPVIHMGHFLHIQSRSTIQARTKNILLKMGAPQGLSLKNVLFSLAEQLKSSN